MKIKPIAPSSSRTRDTQADGFFAAFLGERQNSLYYRNPLQLYPAKAVIVKQDTLANAVYLIEKGLVKIVRVAPKGNKVIIGLRHRDWLIGAPTILLDRPYNFTVIAVVPTLLRGIPKKEFLDHIKKNGQFSWHVHQLLSQQIFDQMKKIEAMSCLAAGDRLARLLVDMVREMRPLGPGMPDSFSVPLTNQELAELLVITPEHLCRVLKEMEQKGLVRRDNGSLIVADPAGLMQTAVV
jgi:CRP-like cAMP-binding protein